MKCIWSSWIKTDRISSTHLNESYSQANNGLGEIEFAIALTLMGTSFGVRIGLTDKLLEGLLIIVKYTEKKNGMNHMWLEFHVNIDEPFTC